MAKQNKQEFLTKNLLKQTLGSNFKHYLYKFTLVNTDLYKEKI
jgi:hypothetical protein